MWTDAARAASMQSRGGDTAAPVANGGGQGAAQGNALQAGLAAGGGSRGRGGGRGKGTKAGTVTTITGDPAAPAAHQAGVQAVQRNMAAKDPGKPLTTLPPAYYPNVAKNAYGYGQAGMPGM